MRRAWANAAALRSEKSVGCTMERMEEFIAFAAAIDCGQRE
jgi:hypothetical protein